MVECGARPLYQHHDHTEGDDHRDQDPRRQRNQRRLWPAGYEVDHEDGRRQREEHGYWKCARSQLLSET